MPYELDFIGIDVETTNADAICFRWKNESDGYTIGVYDGGTSDYGYELKDHLLKYYFEEGAKKTIDFVICSHSDQDHSAGLSIILDSFNVNHLIMNRPWAHIKELFPKVDDGRITEESLERRLKEAYPYIAELEQLALDKGVEVHDAFQGLKIYDKLQVLSPTKEFYLDLLIDSTKTPFAESSIVSRVYSKLKKAIKNLIESWNTEYLKEDVETSAENEMSIIVLGEMEEDKFLLTGDAGIRALRLAIDFSESLDTSLKDVMVYQIPHHGSRHNVSPSILNDMVGNIIPQYQSSTKTAVVSVAKVSDHPRQMVVNAFCRRGADVFEARTKTLCYFKNMPDRPGWSAASKTEFDSNVEDWD